MNHQGRLGRRSIEKDARSREQIGEPIDGGEWPAEDGDERITARETKLVVVEFGVSHPSSLVRRASVSDEGAGTTGAVGWSFM